MRKIYLLLLFVWFAEMVTPIFSQTPKSQKERKMWIHHMTNIAEPVLLNLSQNTLRKNMPVETTQEGSKRGREQVSHLEALGRTICGISPWLELGPDASKEGQLRERYIRMTLAGLKNALDSSSADFLPFSGDKQILVDAALLAQGLMRAPKQLWERLDKKTQILMINSMKETRKIKPNESNWLFFSATVEAFLYQVTGSCKFEVIDYAMSQFQTWYKGDSWYGDGSVFHFDYYNSLIIHPMMYDVLVAVKAVSPKYGELLALETIRFVRHAEQLERLISPEGSYPAVGRSLVYRFGAFHALSQVALLKKLPTQVSPAQVRSALSAVIARQMKVKGNFDENGWLTLGFCGHQPEVAESYISTGSLYLSTAVFLALGLPATDEFWTAPKADWTNKKAWNGKDFLRDKALKD